MEAIVLAGGLGSRLGHLTKHTPKPMLPIRGIPFLRRLLVHLKKNGFAKVILAVSYKRQVIESYFSSSTGDNLPNIDFSIENEPLGTGGAIANALTLTSSNNVFVINGDSFLHLDYKKIYDFHILKMSDITIASCLISSAGRYGILVVNKDSRVVGFQEKGSVNQGVINGGVYILNVEKMRKKVTSITKKAFSFEEEVLSNSSLLLNTYAFKAEGYFLDIGVPGDYDRAQKELFI